MFKVKLQEMWHFNGLLVEIFVLLFKGKAIIYSTLAGKKFPQQMNQILIWHQIHCAWRFGTNLDCHTKQTMSTYATGSKECHINTSVTVLEQKKQTHIGSIYSNISFSLFYILRLALHLEVREVQEARRK